MEKPVDKDKVKIFAERVFQDMAGAMTAGMGYLGVVTGLFRVMAGKGPMRCEDVVRAAGLEPRYVEEWLKGMSAAGYLDYDPARESYALADERAFLLASDETDHFMGGLFAMAPALLKVAPQVADAFRNGGGVPFAAFGDDGILALDLANRGAYEHRFTGYWLKALPDIVARLEAGGHALDVGCGAGRVAVALANAFPRAEIVGIDPDAASIERAEATAAAAGVGERIRFETSTADALVDGPRFDLITACDCVHDFAAPEATLATLRALLASEGALFVVEPKAADHLEENRGAIGTMFYGFSLFHCMTQSLAQGGPGLGTCMGPAATEKLLRRAGFTRFERLDIKSPVNLFYAARP